MPINREQFQRDVLATAEAIQEIQISKILGSG